MNYKVKLLVDYPDAKGIEAAIPEVMDSAQVVAVVARLYNTEPEMIGFVMTVEKVA